MKQIHWALMVLLLECWAADVFAVGSRWDQPTPPLSGPVTVRVHRSASCTCCGKWVQHLRRHGFHVEDTIEADMDVIKDRLAIPEDLRSCHTAEVSGHVVEGHVPAADIKRLLGARTALYGLSVPGMPAGTPGMEVGGRMAAFSVIGFNRDGTRSVFSKYSDE